MATPDKAFHALLELGDPSVRRNRSELLDRALRTALLMTDADAVALTTTHRRGERLVLHSGSAQPAAMPLPPEGSEVIRRLAESCQPVVLADLPEDRAVAAADACPGVESGPVLFTPVRRRDHAPAYLAVYRRRGRARFTATDTRAMLLLAAWMGAATDNLRLATGTEKLAITDPLTDVYNFRYLKSALRREIRRASRFGQELSIVKIGVDGLEAKVAEFGDLKSGLLLKELAAVLAQQVRSFDVMARNGDDGFTVILPQTHRDGAAEVAERMRAAVEQRAFSQASAGEITVSMGVASFPQDAAEINDLVAAAGRALQQAQERGGNGVVALSSPPSMTDLGTLIAPRKVKRSA